MKSQSHRPLMALVSVILGTLSVGALIALAQRASGHFDPAIAYAFQPRGAAASASTVPISITESGFEPATVTVTVGTAVMWTNHLSETVHLVSGQPHCVYLPLVVRNFDGAGAATGASAATIAEQQEGNWADVDIAPGTSYSHTFTTAGDYPYFLSTDPHVTGLVVVTGDTTPPEVQITDLNHPDYTVPHIYEGFAGTVPSTNTLQFTDASYDNESGIGTITLTVQGLSSITGTQASHFSATVTWVGARPFTYTVQNGAGLVATLTGTITGTNQIPSTPEGPAGPIHFWVGESFHGIDYDSTDPNEDHINWEVYFGPPELVIGYYGTFTGIAATPGDYSLTVSACDIWGCAYLPVALIIH